MSKRSTKSHRSQASPKPQKKNYNPTSWLTRPSIATEQDPFLKKIFRLLSAVALLAIIALALRSGINGDDQYQNDYSTKLVNYYSTMGADTSALHIEKGNMHYYGGFFDIVTGFTNKALGLEVADAGYHQVRHFFNAIFGFLVLLFTSLLVREIAGWRAAILALVFLFLSPRLLGHALMNPKDIPFAAGYMMALYYMLFFFRKMPVPDWKAALGVVCGIALAIATRAGGLLLVAYLVLFAGIDFLIKNGFSNLTREGKKLGQYALWTLGVAVAGYALALLFWPYALQSPLKHPMEALGEFSKLGVKIRVLFAGENLMSDQTPWDYLLQWIWRTIPLFTLFGFLGSLFLLKRIFTRYQVLPVFMALFAAVFPVFYIIYKDSILHDGWRHLLFTYPAMVVMAVLFFVSLEDILKENKTGRYALYAAIGLMALEPAVFIARNSKFPYVYFNSLSGGISKAFGNYETDYWGLSVKQAMDWLEQQGKISPNMQDTVTIATSFSYAAHVYADKKFGGKVQVKYTRFNNRYETDWDYGIFPSRYIKGPHMGAHTWPNKRSIHVITANGVPLTAIEQGGGPVFEGEKAFKVQNWQVAIEDFKKEVAQYSDNEIAWMKLSMAYLNTSNFAEAKSAANKLLEITPKNASGLLYRGIANLNLGDQGAAESDFRQAVKIEDDFSTGYYYLALVEYQRNNATAALQHLQKTIELSPRFKAAYELAAQIYEAQGDVQRAAQYREVAAQM